MKTISKFILMTASLTFGFVGSATAQISVDEFLGVWKSQGGSTVEFRLKGNQIEINNVEPSVVSQK